jgi:hypothetical protein
MGKGRFLLASVMMLGAELWYLTPRMVERIREMLIEDEVDLYPYENRQRAVLLYVSHKNFWAALVRRRKGRVKCRISDQPMSLWL